MILRTMLVKSLDLLVQMSSEDNTFADTIVPTVKFSMIVAPFILIFNKIVSWSMANQDYMLFVLGAILLDWVFGTIKHWVENSFDLGSNAKGLIVKISLAVGGGFLFEGVTYLVGYSIISETLQVITRTIVFLYPAISAWKNMNHLSGGEFPPKLWIKKVDKVYENMDIRNLKKDGDTDNK